MWSAIVVSKPLRGAVAAGLNEVAEAPARTFHAVTCVAPFQLASTVVAPPALACAATAGSVFGSPLQGARKVRKSWTWSPSVASKRTAPELEYSVKLGSPP